MELVAAQGHRHGSAQAVEKLAVVLARVPGRQTAPRAEAQAVADSWDHIEANDVKSEFSHAGGMGRAEVAGSNDGESQGHSTRLLRAAT